MNALYQQLNQQQGNDIVSRFNQFKNSFKGDPQQMIQQMMQSGRISQAQYNDAVNKAQMLGRLLNMK